MDFLSNTAGDDGGAIGTNDGFWADIVLSGVTFQDNVADDAGGAIMLVDVARFQATDVVFDGNHLAHEDTTLYHGGAIWFTGAGELEFRDTRFTSNAPDDIFLGEVHDSCDAGTTVSVGTCDQNGCDFGTCTEP